MIERLKSIDNNRFRVLLDAFDIKDECFKCAWFDSTLEMSQAYRCAITGKCIGITLSESFKGYLWGKLGE